MQFFSLQFFIFFIIVFSGNWLLKKWPIVWKIFLLLSSYAFCMSWDVNFVFVLIGATAINYLLGELVWRYDNKLVLSLGIFINVSFLVLLKYYDFFRISAENFVRFFGFHVNFFVVSVLFPAGLSFYILRAISYIFDIYRHKNRPAFSLLDFANYMAFFPQLFCGPIARANEFFPQLNDGGSKAIINFHEYGASILNGLFKKLVISSYLSIEIVDKVFAVPSNYSSIYTLLAVYAYAIVIYCDFSGYSDISIGIAGLLGFKSPKNFDKPYTAINLQDFWRRWHISLSTWFRDYLYIPLGGNVGSLVKTYLNTIIVMLVSGMWHGVGWTFIFWGLLHGIGLIVYKIWHNFKSSNANINIINRSIAEKSKNFAKNFLPWFLTFNYVSFCWIFFRAQNIKIGFDVLRQIFIFDFSYFDYGKIIYILFVSLIFFFIGESLRDKIIALQKKLPFFWQVLVVCVLFIVIIQVSPKVVPPFIYASF
jgi:D-alanyl-lipoteichoic acid acyltransferase DltB (MBOAT superfamily)